MDDAYTMLSKNRSNPNKPPKATKEKKPKDPFFTGLRWFLFILILVDLVVGALTHPGYFGDPAIEEALTAAAGFFHDTFWPRGPQDVDTYRHTIYEISTWIQSLPVYPFLAGVLPLGIPIFWVLTFPLEKLVGWLKGFKGSVKPKKTKKAKEKKPQEPKPTDSGVGKTGPKILSGIAKPVSGMDKDKAKAANSYHSEMVSRCAVAFSDEPGVWVRVFSPETGEEEFIRKWMDNGQIILEGVADDPIRLKLEGGRAFWDAYQLGWTEISRHSPIVVSHDNRGGQSIPQCIITWL